MPDKHKLLIVHDIEVPTNRGEPIRWAYAQRSYCLQKYAPDDFEVRRCSAGDFSIRDAHWADVTFFLDYTSVRSTQRDFRKHRVKAKRVYSFNKDSNSRQSEYEATVRHADFVIINNEERYLAGGMQPNTCCITNPVDTKFWRHVGLEQGIDRQQKVIWCGSSGPNKRKRYQSLIRPLGELLTELGAAHDFRPINDITPSLKTPTEQLAWYNSADIVVCASETEGGGPSYISESVACGCVAVTVPVGGIPEWAIDRVNCVLVEPTIDSFIEGIAYARLNWNSLSALGEKAMRDASFEVRGPYFFQVFRKMIRNEPIQPFSYRDKHWRDL